ncbi:MAG TPA: hypothetical protein VK927_08390 [Adhaeribacter sp.]|nr:hypothetical protein [Adhaeribacter sp.]
MRNYEDIGYGSFNTYRSGDENSRRNLYGSSPSNQRGGSSVYGQQSRDTSSADHNYSTDPGYYGTTGSASSRRSQTNYENTGYGQGSSQYGQNRSQQQPQSSHNRPSSGQGWTSQSQNQGSQYGSSYGSSRGSSDYGNRSENRGSSWVDRAGNRMENWADRAENQLDRWGNRASNAWDRMTDDDDRNRRSSGWSGPSGHHSQYSHGNAGQNRYSDNYDSPENYSGSSYGSSYPSSYGNRYENREGYRNRHEDEGGFFDNLGNKISNAWDRWVGDDDDEERRYQQRSHYRPSGRTSSNDGPPYNYGSSSRRDYEW